MRASGERSMAPGRRHHPQPRAPRAKVRLWFRLDCWFLLAACLGFWSVGARAERVAIGGFQPVAFGVSRGHPYPIEGGDGRRTGRSDARAPAAKPSLLWAKRQPMRRLQPPAIAADGTLYVAGEGGVVALGSDGTQRWFVNSGAFEHTPALTPRGELLLIERSGALLLVDRQGQAKRVNTPDPLVGSPLVTDQGTVVAGTREGAVRVFDLSGSQLTAIGPRHAPPVRVAALDGGLIASMGKDDQLLLFSVHAGLDARHHLPHESLAGPVVADDQTVFWVSDDGSLLGSSPTGRLRVSAQLGTTGLRASPAVGRDGGVRIGVYPRVLVCIGGSGDERWRRGLDGEPGDVTLDVDDTALVVTDRGSLYALEADGALRYRLALRARDVGRPVLGGDGTIYLVTRSGWVQAWR